MYLFVLKLAIYNSVVTSVFSAACRKCSIFRKVTQVCTNPSHLHQISEETMFKVMVKEKNIPTFIARRYCFWSFLLFQWVEPGKRVRVC
jgi:hypothetical protein